MPAVQNAILPAHQDTGRKGDAEDRRGKGKQDIKSTQKPYISMKYPSNRIKIASSSEARENKDDPQASREKRNSIWNQTSQVESKRVLSRYHEVNRFKP